MEYRSARNLTASHLAASDTLSHMNYLNLAYASLTSGRHLQSTCSHQIETSDAYNYAGVHRTPTARACVAAITIH